MLILLDYGLESFLSQWYSFNTISNVLKLFHDGKKKGVRKLEGLPFLFGHLLHLEHFVNESLLEFVGESLNFVSGFTHFLSNESHEFIGRAIWTQTLVNLYTLSHSGDGVFVYSIYIEAVEIGEGIFWEFLHPVSNLAEVLQIVQRKLRSIR